MNTFRQSFYLFKKNLRSIVGFEIVYRLFCIALMLPCVTACFQLSLRLAGYHYLSEDRIFSYLVHQPRRLMGYETQVLDLTSEQLVTYRVEMNHKTRPVVVSIETTETDLYKKKHYASIMEHDRELAKLDQELAEYMLSLIHI